jgi:hypothetical protein
MSNNNSNNKIIPVAVALIGAITTIVVALINAGSQNDNEPRDTPTSPTSTATPPSSIVGNYKITGNNPEGGTYKAKLTITGSGSTYKLVWEGEEEQPYTGVGILRGNNLAVSWGNSKCSVVSYQVQDNGSLEGEWIMHNQDGIGTEVAVPSSSASTNDIVGQYTIAGKDPGSNGSAYRETLSIKAMGSLYKFLWADSNLEGVGIIQGNTVAVGFGSVPCNVVLYQVRGDGNLSGIWGLYNQDRIGTEDAVRQ